MKVFDPAHQSRDGALSRYEDELAAVLEDILDQGKHDLLAIVAELNERNVPTPEGIRWSVDVFRQEMARLGA